MIRTPQPDELHYFVDSANMVVLVAVVVEGGKSILQSLWRKTVTRNLVVTRKCTRLLLGVDCLLQLPPLVDGG